MYTHMYYIYKIISDLIIYLYLREMNGASIYDKRDWCYTLYSWLLFSAEKSSLTLFIELFTKKRGKKKDAFTSTLVYLYDLFYIMDTFIPNYTYLLKVDLQRLF